MTMRGFLGLLTVLMTAPFVGAVTLDASLIQTSGTPTVGSGKFYGIRQSTPTVEGDAQLAFSNAYAVAVAEGVPLVVIWSNENCDHCSDFIAEVNGSSEQVSSWMKTQDAVFAFFKDNLSDEDYEDWYYALKYKRAPSKIHYPAACYDAWHFSSGVCGAEACWPLFAFYYRRSDGKEIVWGTKMDRTGSTRTWTRLKSEYASWIVKNKIPSRYCGGSFVSSGGQFDRYEAEPTTSYVDVELEREADRSNVGYEQKLAAFWPSESAARWSTNLVWTVGETAKVVRVSLARAPEESFVEGEITLKLYDKSGGVKTSTPIVCRAAVANSAENPLWKTERTIDSLDYGEWTCDLDTATNKVAQVVAAGEEAWTLVYSHGSQWCPYCYLNGQSFVGTADFLAWAKEHRVVLVSADMPHCSDSDPSKDYGTIWHRKADTTNLYFDGLGAQARSGRGFLSRKMVSDDEAWEMREVLHELNTSFLHLPEDYQASRAIIPGLTLIDSSGKVVGRMETFDYDMNNHTDGSKAEVYCRRLTEMLTAARTAPDRASENLNDNCVTTPLRLPVYAAVGETSSVSGMISHADYRDVYRVTGVAPGVSARFTCRGTRSAQTRLCLLKGNARGEVTDMVLSVTNLLSKALVIDTSAIEDFSFETNATYFVRVASHSIMPKSSSNYRPYRLRWGDGDDGFSHDYASDYDGDTLTSYEIKAEAVCYPAEARRTVEVPDGGVVMLSVEPGETYRLTGFDTAMMPEELTKVPSLGADFYRVTPPAEWVGLAAKAGGSTIGYQVWHTGTVSFVQSAQTVYTHMGDATIRVVRQGGVSGERTEWVRLVYADEYADGRYEWSDASVTWADGEDGEKTVTLGIVPPGEVQHSTGRLTFAIGDSRLSVSLMDTDAPSLELLDYTTSTYQNFSTCLSFDTVNLLTDGYVYVRVVSGALPTGTHLAYDRETGKVSLEGEPLGAGTYEFDVSLAEIRPKGGYVSGPISTVRVTVAETEPINEKLTEARATDILPLYVDWTPDAATSASRSALAGELSVAITSRGRISARYRGTESRTVVFSGSWQDLDEETGIVTTRLEKYGCVLDLSMDRDGTLSATLALPSGFCWVTEGSVVLTAESPWPDDEDFEDYLGYYTVALPVSSGVWPSDLPSGTGCLSLRMFSSSASTGCVGYSGYLPDGRPVSGSVTARKATEEGENVIRLPIFRRMGKNFLSATLAINEKASEKWDAPQEPKKREVINPASGTASLACCRSSAWNYLLELDVIGSYYIPQISPKELSDTFYTNLYGVSVHHLLSFEVDKAQSPSFGSLSVPSAEIIPGAETMTMATSVNGLRFTFDSRKGLFRGTAVVTYANGKKVTGSYHGILTPGWVKNCDCGDILKTWPFGSGFLRYRDFNENGRAVYKTMPLTLDAINPSNR